MVYSKFLLFGILYIVASNVYSQAVRTHKKDSLNKPIFYLLVPKIIEFNSNYTPNYKIRYYDSQAKETEYSNEFINSLKITAPFIQKRDKGLFVSGLLEYHNYSYQTNTSGISKHQNYNIFTYGARVVKRFDFLNKKWVISNSINISGSEAFKIKNVAYYPGLLVTLPLKNDDKLTVGFMAVFNKNIKIPIIPVLNYATWISQKNGLLLTVKLPMVDIKASKIFDNKNFLKLGFSLLNHGHYFNTSDVPFLLEDNEHHFLKRLQLAANTRYEKAIYKSFWLSGEIGYALNYNAGIFEHDKTIASDKSQIPNSVYFNLGIFLRPVSIKK